MKLKMYFLETRPQFLLLSLVLGVLGSSIAWFDGTFHWGHAVLATVGLLLTHIAVNVLNDYFDYRSGIDLAVQRTPFSGGSGVLPAGALTPPQVLRLGLGAFLLAIPVAIYFLVVSGLWLLPLLLIGAFCVLFYTPLLTRGVWPELFAGLGLGTLPVLGVYFTQTDGYTFPAVMAAVPSGILVHNLLLLNEFPDVEADRQGGRRTLPLVLGLKRTGFVYSALTVGMYLWIVGCVAGTLMPTYALVSLATLPAAIRAIQGSFRYSDRARLVAALGQNVMVVLLTQLLLGVGYVLARAL